MRRTSRRSLLGLCATLALVTSAGPAACGGGDDDSDAAAKPRTIDRARAVGDRAVAKAAGSVRHPRAVAIRVSAAPKQRVTVVWALSCTDGDGKEQTTGGTYSARPPNIRSLKLPADAASKICALDTTARILAGRVKATLLAVAP